MPNSLPADAPELPEGGGASGRADLVGVLPAALLLVYAGWLGTFHGAAEGARAAIGQGLLISAAVATLAVLLGRRHPGSRGSGARQVAYLLPGLLALALPWAASPVPRAGSTALLLAPAYGLVPLGVSLCWLRPRARLWGARALSAVAGLLGAWALISWQVLGTDGASLPLGHHNPLALCLVALLPAALLSGVRPPARGLWALLGGLSGILVLGAILATRSLAGAAALAAVALVALVRGRGSGAGTARGGPISGNGTGAGLRPAFRWPLATALLGGLAWLAWPRLQAILEGGDASVNARITYWRAAWRGFLERPMLGWGPGSSHWTLAEHLRPVPGVNPPGQVVAEPHNLPLMLLYELGLLGTVLLGLAVAGFSSAAPTFREGRPRPAPMADLGLRRAAALGLLGLGVASMGGMPASIPALPSMALLLLGMLQAGAGSPPRSPARHPAPASSAQAGPGRGAARGPRRAL
ncbi:MAG: O-antigen ligase family protein, partial [Holophagales bacterium]|nr:O-antigen ligase family protein [Holophagales bacterium]